MQKISLDEFAAMCKGRLIKGSKDTLIDSVTVDSRLCKKGGAFFALSGAVTDGHRFIEKAAQNGAAVAVVSSETFAEGIALIKVDDTFEALKEAARAYRKKFDIPYIAVTGSSGKTTTKDLIAAVLAEKYNVHKTSGNLNSSTGVPLTVFDLCEQNEISVVEMSMSHKGEIFGNAYVVEPECAVITNIGMSHVEFLGSQENIFKAKCEVFSYFNRNDTLIYNGDDMWLNKLKNSDFNTVSFGVENADIKASEIIQSAEGVEFSAEYNGKKTKYHFDYPGIHNVRNCLCAIAVALKYGLTEEEIQRGYDKFTPGSNRMQIVNKAGVTFINDSYNSNPDALNAALSVLEAKAFGRKIAVLGDMLELGESSARLHRQSGKNAALYADILLTTGVFGQEYISGFQEGGGAASAFYEKKEDLVEALIKELKKGDTVLFKASRGVKLDEVFKTVSERLS